MWIRIMFSLKTLAEQIFCSTVRLPRSWWLPAGLWSRWWWAPRRIPSYRHSSRRRWPSVWGTTWRDPATSLYDCTTTGANTSVRLTCLMCKSFTHINTLTNTKQGKYRNMLYLFIDHSWEKGAEIFHRLMRQKRRSINMCFNLF